MLHQQLVDILSGLNSLSGSSPDDTKEEAKWAYIGVGRDDGLEAGEYSPILYRTDVWEVLHWKTVWLSQTPDVPSKGWDAASTRIVTVGLFRSLATGQEVLVMSTHLDDQGTIARLESAKLINALAAKEKEENRCPVVLAGDFNSEPDEEAYKEMVQAGVLVDVTEVVDGKMKYGCWDTFTGFDGEGDGAGVKRIDFVFVSTDREEGDGEEKVGGKLEVKSYAVLDNGFDGGVKSSDHRAVVVDLVLTGSDD